MLLPKTIHQSAILKTIFIYLFYVIGILPSKKDDPFRKSPVSFVADDFSVPLRLISRYTYFRLVESVRA